MYSIPFSFFLFFWSVRNGYLDERSLRASLCAVIRINRHNKAGSRCDLWSTTPENPIRYGVAREIAPARTMPVVRKASLSWGRVVTLFCQSFVKCLSERHGKRHPYFQVEIRTKILPSEVRMSSKSIGASSLFSRPARRSIGFQPLNTTRTNSQFDFKGFSMPGEHRRPFFGAEYLVGP